MNKLSKIKLIQLNKSDLISRQLSALKGGRLCYGCGCLCQGDSGDTADSYDGMEARYPIATDR